MKTFGRKAIFQILGKEITYPELYLEFEVNFDTTSEGNVGYVRFYNLSTMTVKLLQKGTPFILKAGYAEDIGFLLPGVVISSSTYVESTSKLTEVIIGDNTDTWLTSMVNQTWRAGVKASKIAKHIVKNLPLKVGEIVLNNDVTYTKGKTFSTTRKKALEEIAKDTDTKLHVSRGKIYLRPETLGSQEVVILNKDTGLISSPQQINYQNEERYKVQSLLNYRIESDTILKIESKTIDGLYRVSKGSHRLNGNDFLTELEVISA